MLDYSLLQNLPDADDTPVDHELQDLIPHLLKSILAMIWSDRWDWFFCLDMGIYYDPDKSGIVPDGFLSLGVPRIKNQELRPSYVLWKEQAVPILALEVISKTSKQEYSKKRAIAAREKTRLPRNPSQTPEPDIKAPQPPNFGGLRECQWLKMVSVMDKVTITVV